MLKYFVLGCSSLALCVALGCGGEAARSSNFAADIAPAALESEAVATPAAESSTSSFMDTSSAGMGGMGSSDAAGMSAKSPATSEAEVAASPTRTTSPRSEEAAKSSIADEAFVPESRKTNQSGLLTAGSFDDVSNFSDYQSFLAKFRGHRQISWPLQTNSRQTLITVRDGQGNPIGNARCRVTAGQIHGVLLDARTGSDGRVMLLADHEVARNTNGLRLQVWSPQSQEVIIDQTCQPGRRWEVAATETETALPTALDLALVIDTTGSMGDELEYLKTEIDSIVESVNKMFPNVDQRYSLITYRDNGDDYVSRSFDFTGSLTDFRKNLDKQSANGGGDFPEAMDAALKSAEQLSWRKGNTARVLFLVGDAPPHQQNINRALESVKGLGKQGVRIFPVGASGVEATAQIVMRTSAFLTMGQYLFLTDHSGVGNAHATPDVPEFAVERLNRLMVRMIASELAGKRLAPQEVLAIERGELHTSTLHQQCTPAVVICPTPEPKVAPCCVSTQLVSASVSAGIDDTGIFVMLTWIAQNGLVALVALISAVLVFDSLSSRFSD